MVGCSLTFSAGIMGGPKLKTENTTVPWRQKKGAVPQLADALPWGLLEMKDQNLISCNATLSRDLGLGTGEDWQEGQVAHAWSTLESKKLKAGDEIELIDGQTKRVPFRIESIKTTADGQRQCVMKCLAHHAALTKVADEQKTRLNLAARLALFGEISASITHDLATPLAVVLGLAEQLADQAHDKSFSASTVKICRKIEETTSRMLLLTRRLKNITRGLDEDPITRTPVAKLIQDALDFSRDKINQHGISILFTPPESSLTLDCRSAQITQMMINLINSAHSAIAALKEKWIKISVNDLGTMVKISVSASAENLTSEPKSLAIVPFPGTRPSLDSLDLGLTISHVIAKDHQGALTIGTDDQHTCIEVCLPKVQREGASI